jgi:hypothetical protein
VIAAMSPGSATGSTRAVLGRRRQREACAREQPNRDQSIDMQLREMGGRVTYPEQLQEDTGPILLINQFNVAPEDAGGACAPMACVTAALQSPPCATNSVYPRRCISTTHARAIRTGSQPVVVGLAENPWPGSDGITRWNPSASLPPCDVGSVSGSMIFSCSMIEPANRA